MEIRRDRYLERLIEHKGNVIRHNDENGILIMSLQEFLMDEGALEK